MDITIDISSIINTVLGIGLGVSLVFLFRLIMSKIKPKKTPETVSGFSLYNKAGMPIAWFREMHDVERYKNGTNGRQVVKTMENDFYFYKA